MLMNTIGGIMDYSKFTPNELERKRFNSIFVIEMMERVGFYAFNTIVVMYFIYQFHLTKSDSASLFGAFAALLYVFIPIGGWVGDFFLGTKRTIILGGIFLLCGYVILSSSMNENMLFLGMGTIIIGNGLFKSNPASLLSKIFPKNDSGKRDSAYLMYHMAINVGSFSSGIFSPIIAHTFGWQWGFASACVGLIIGLINFMVGKKYFQGISSAAGERGLNLWRYLSTIIVAIGLIFVCSWLLHHISVTQILMFTIIGITFLIFFICGLRQEPGTRAKMISALVLAMMAICFYTLHQQMSLSFTFFGMCNSAYNIFGIPVHPEQFQVVNSLTVLIFAPILSIFAKRAGIAGKNARITTKFTIGLFVSSLAFLVLVPAQYFGHNGIVSSNWIVSAYFIITFGELFVSALGLSMMSQLVPEKFMGFAVGVWYLALSMAGVTGSMVSNMTYPKGAQNLSPVQSLPIFCHAFEMIGIMTLGATVLMFVVKLILDKYIYEDSSIKKTHVAETL